MIHLRNLRNGDFLSLWSREVISRTINTKNDVKYQYSVEDIIESFESYLIVLSTEKKRKNMLSSHD